MAQTKELTLTPSITFPMLDPVPSGSRCNRGWKLEEIITLWPLYQTRSLSTAVTMANDRIIKLCLSNHLRGSQKCRNKKGIIIAASNTFMIIVNNLIKKFNYYNWQLNHALPADIDLKKSHPQCLREMTKVNVFARL